jgi:hypothetical protein
VESARAGIVLDDITPTTIARRLRTMAADPIELARAGAAGHEYVAAEHDAAVQIMLTVTRGRKAPMSVPR